MVFEEVAWVEMYINDEKLCSWNRYTNDALLNKDIAVYQKLIL